MKGNKNRPKSCARQLSHSSSSGNASRRKQWLIIIGSALLIIGLLFLAGHWFFSKTKQPFRQVEISSSGHAVKVAHLQALIERYTGQGFFALDVKRLQGQISLLPWVESVSIRRVWPDRLRVFIRERHAVAIWNENQLLTREAERFQPELSTFPPYLPRLSGPSNEEKRVLATYMHANQHLHTLGLQLIMLSSFNHVWRMHIKNGPVVLLSGETDKALRRFDVLYRRLLKGKLAQVAQVDLRYAGAAAVRWSDHRK